MAGGMFYVVRRRQRFRAQAGVFSSLVADQQLSTSVNVAAPGATAEHDARGASWGGGGSGGSGFGRRSGSWAFRGDGQPSQSVPARYPSGEV